jgi:hypothetical protein
MGAVFRQIQENHRRAARQRKNLQVNLKADFLQVKTLSSQPPRVVPRSKPSQPTLLSEPAFTLDLSQPKPLQMSPPQKLLNKLLARPSKPEKPSLQSSSPVEEFYRPLEVGRLKQAERVQPSVLEKRRQIFEEVMRKQKDQ